LRRVLIVASYHCWGLASAETTSSVAIGVVALRQRTSMTTDSASLICIDYIRKTYVWIRM
jgi:hypothetical protein